MRKDKAWKHKYSVLLNALQPSPMTVVVRDEAVFYIVIIRIPKVSRMMLKSVVASTSSDPVMCR